MNRPNRKALILIVALSLFMAGAGGIIGFFAGKRYGTAAVSAMVMSNLHAEMDNFKKTPVLPHQMVFRKFVFQNFKGGKTALIDTVELMLVNYNKDDWFFHMDDNQNLTATPHP